MAEIDIHSSERPVLIQVDENKNVSDREFLNTTINVIDNAELETVAFDSEEGNVTSDFLNKTLILDSNCCNLSKEMLENIQEPSSECLNNSTLVPDASFEVVTELNTTRDLEYKIPVNLMDTSNVNGIEDKSFSNENDNFFKHPSEVFQPLVDLTQDIKSMKDEEFHDAVQYFKNPSDFDCLSTAGNSNSESSITRCSLYMNFDPLHAVKQEVKSTKNDENSTGLTEDNANESIFIKKVDNDDDAFIKKDNADESTFIKKVDNADENIFIEKEDAGEIIFIKKEDNFTSEDTEVSTTSPILIKKDIVSKVCFDNTLISFESPIKSKESSVLEVEKPVPKLYSEEEFAQALKAEELKQQHILLRKQQELEKKEQECERKKQEAENELQESERKVLALSKLCRTWPEIINGHNELVSHLLNEKKAAETAFEKQNVDLKTAQDDLQNVEGAFADFHKRYESLKTVIRTLQENESHLKLQIEEMLAKIEEKEKMYELLQSRTQSSLDNANKEIANVKNNFEAQLAVLNAQAKKDKMKIASLEDHNKQLKGENEKLDGMCDDLMAKVKESY